jgi:V8-like Glu-specific endopeptidase
VDKYFFVFDMPVTKGVSGSPVFRGDDEDFKIVSAHTKNIDKLITSFHASLKLRTEIFENMKENITQLCYSWDCSKH